MENTEKKPTEKQSNRLALGEAWMLCNQCMAKLYSFDGNEDRLTNCPDTKKCDADNDRMKSN